MKVESKDTMDKANEGGNVFLEVVEGEMTVRLMTDIEGVKEHRVNIDDRWRYLACPHETAKWEALVNDSQVKDFPNCPLCEKGYPVRAAYLAVAINRDNGEVGVLKKGATVFGPITELREDDNWGDPKNYDLKIKATGAGLKRKYVITPIPKDKSQELSEEDLNNVGLFTNDTDIVDMTKPREYDDIKERTAGLSPYKPE